VSFVEPDFAEEGMAKPPPPARRSARISAFVVAYVALVVGVILLGAAAGVGVLVFKWVSGV
jgi:hypothetical protein